MICTFFITLLGINGYIMVFVLYPIADSLLRENKMDRRLLPFLMIAGGANANGFAFSMDICNVIPSNFLGTSLGVAPVLAVIFSVITCTWYVIYFNYAQKEEHGKNVGSRTDGTVQNRKRASWEITSFLVCLCLFCRLSWYWQW